MRCSTAQSLSTISIHALREEGDSFVSLVDKAANKFLSTPSARRATKSRFPAGRQALKISIHALREEGDSVTLTSGSP